MKTKHDEKVKASAKHGKVQTHKHGNRREKTKQENQKKRKPKSLPD
jgi:hypothetical protein